MAILAYLLAAVLDPTSVVTGEATVPPHTYLHPPIECDSRAPTDEIVVCGTRDADERYRLRPIDEGRYRDDPIVAETKFLGGKLKAHVDEGAFGSTRAMITFAIPF
ncbi:hypothetical protein [Sphingomonas crusticola]|uniref:hypothetical protein n=1 Tax=Sphingomonas crusticola TaxID=1697973 RepID=UPI000E234953|nr:hypothetical protein [Sphingomonas crusticola]